MFCHIMRRRLVQWPVLASPFGEVQGKDEQQQKTRAQRKNMWFERVNTSVAEYQLDFIMHLPLVFHVMFFFHPTNWTFWLLTADKCLVWTRFSRKRAKKCGQCAGHFFFFACCTFYRITVASNCKLQVLQTLVFLLNGPNGSRRARSATVWGGWAPKYIFFCGK